MFNSGGNGSANLGFTFSCRKIKEQAVAILYATMHEKSTQKIA